MRVPLLALTGGDPLCRPDLFPVIEFAAKHSVRTALTLLPTPKLDRSIIPELKELGLIRVGMWLHGRLRLCMTRFGALPDRSGGLWKSSGPATKRSFPYRSIPSLRAGM